MLPLASTWMMALFLLPALPGPTCNTHCKHTMMLLITGSPDVDSPWKVPKRSLFSFADHMIATHHHLVFIYRITALLLTFPSRLVIWFAIWDSLSTTNLSGSIMFASWLIALGLASAQSKYLATAYVASTSQTGGNSTMPSPCPPYRMVSNSGGLPLGNRALSPLFAPHRTSDYI